jgi:hypothetical protein
MFTMVQSVAVITGSIKVLSGWRFALELPRAVGFDAMGCELEALIEY